MVCLLGVTGKNLPIGALRAFSRRNLAACCSAFDHRENCFDAYRAGCAMLGVFPLVPSQLAPFKDLQRESALGVYLDEPFPDSAQRILVADTARGVQKKKVVDQLPWYALESLGTEHCVIDCKPVLEALAIRVAPDDVGAFGTVEHIAATRLDVAGRADDARPKFRRQVGDDALRWYRAWHLSGMPQPSGQHRLNCVSGIYQLLTIHRASVKPV